MLRKEVRGENHCENDDSSGQMSPGIDSFIVPLKQTAQQRRQGVAHTISPYYSWVEL